MNPRATKQLLVSILAAFASPAFANEFGHAWSCELQTGKTIADARAVSTTWLAAARSMKGGDQLKVYMQVPIVMEGSANRFEFVLLAPSLEAWGTFYDGYHEDSPVGKADVDFAEVATCSGSTLWESMKIE
jgi:hypothetical protein